MRSLQIVGNARFGGATLLMLAWSAYLRDRGWTVDVLATDETMAEAVVGELGLNLVDDIWIPKQIEPRTDAVALRRLHRLIRDRRYDVVHTYTATPSFLGRLAATAARVPVVVNHQGGWAVNPTSSTMERAIYTPLEFVGNLLCTRNICVSHSERDKGLVNRLGPDHKLVTIVNGIDTSAIDAALAGDARARMRAQLGCGPDTVLFGTTGRLVPGKGNRSVVEAMALLCERHPDLDVRLAMAGDGEERDEMVDLVAERGLEGRVELLGFVENIPGFLAGLDVFVTASLTEGLSVALLEAMAARLPVISTAITANAEVAHHGVHGLLVEVEAPDRLADAMARLGTDRVLADRLGRAGRARVESHYGMDRMFAQTWDLYSRLLVEAGRPDPNEGSGR